MLKKINLLAGVFALLMFGYAQQQGWNLFDDVAHAGSGRPGGSGRVYHK